MPKKAAVVAGKLEPVRFAPFFIDWTFKSVLGKAGGESLLMAIINDFLARILPHPIKKIKYLPTELLGTTQKSKKVIFDILCEDSAGDKYLIEMQNAKLKTASDRIRLYISRLQSESLDSGANLHLLGEKPANFRGRIFDRIFSVAEISKLKGDELKAFRYSMKLNIDERQLAIDCAVEEATEAAIVQGIRQGRKLGRKLGRKQGWKQGISVGVLQTAKRMLAKGFSVADVFRATELPRKQIMALKRA